MGRMKDLLGDELAPSYPVSPGYTDNTTSKEAAKSVETGQRDAHRSILDLLSTQPLSADEIAERLGWTVLYCRPRVTELNRLGKIEPDADDYGAVTVHKNSSGKWAKVWRIKRG